MNYTRLFLTICLFGVVTINSQAQTASPATPKKFVTRKNGSSTGAGSSVGLVSAAKTPKPQIITYTALTSVREWENSDGKVMKARLLAFPSPNDNNTSSESDKIPHFTVIRDQKVRFLMNHNKKAIIYPLENLSETDQEFIEEIAQAAARAAKNTSPQQKKTASDADKANEEPSSEKK